MPILRLVNYNIRSAQHQPEGLEAIAATIHELQPDVLALQEVDRGTERSGRTDQAAIIADLIGLSHHRFASATEWSGGGQYGVALLSRYPLQNAVVTPLYVPTDPSVRQSLREPRTLLSATIDVDGSPMRVLATHLGLDDAQRRIQIREIAAAVDQAAAFTDTIVLGDLNCPPDADALSPLTARLHDAHGHLDHAERGTYPTDPSAPASDTIVTDYILVPRTWTVEDSFVFHSEHAPRASDHYAVVSRVSFGKGRK